jgi:histone-binding protein RBBP4
MPQNPCLIATRTVHGDVLLYDYTKHPSVPSGDGARPDLRLTGHRAEGYGLCWNRQRKGWLLSSDNDGAVCVWDVTQGNRENRTISPVHVLRAGSAPIEDVCWHAYQPDTLTSVGDDRRLLLYAPPICMRFH